jgi:hypothetical protein
MHDPTKLPVEMWAEIVGDRTRIMISVNGAEAFQLMSYPSTYVAKDGVLRDPTFPTLIPVSK